MKTPRDKKPPVRSVSFNIPVPLYEALATQAAGHLHSVGAEIRSILSDALTATAK